MDATNAKGLPRNADGEREWSHGLFECGNDPMTFVISFFLPCITYSTNKSRVEYLEVNGKPHPEGGDPVTNDTIFHGALTMCGRWGWLLQIGTRQNLRSRYHIQGAQTDDILLSCCCAPCALTQEAQEIALEEQAVTGKY